MIKRSGLCMVFVLLIAASVAACSPGGAASPAPARTAEDAVVIAWVNDRPIYRTALVTLADSMRASQGLSPEEANQAAFNRLVQNALIHEIAKAQGITVSDAEVDERVRSLLDQAKENEELRGVYEAQAAALGVAWDSPAFADHLRQQWREVLPIEKLHQQLFQLAEGNEERARQAKIFLLTEALSTMEIRLEESALPELAKNLRIPGPSELPEVTGP